MSVVLVNGLQVQNTSLLSGIKRYTVSNSIKYDYCIQGSKVNILFLSLEYHQLHPEYLRNRIQSTDASADNIILLILVDVVNYHHSLLAITLLTLTKNRVIRIILSWNIDDAAQYINTCAQSINKPPDVIQHKTEDKYINKLTDALTSIKSINKTDTITLYSNFKSFKQIVKTCPEDLSKCPGLGSQKVRRLYDAFNQPFIINRKS